MTRLWTQVTVVGCGLIGGSFAMALRDAKVSETILGWDTDASALDEALNRGIIDDIDRACADGDPSTSNLIYLALPVLEIVEFLMNKAPLASPGTLFTDAGSTKREICLAARKHLSKNVTFVGGHPIAGREVGGIAHARADLFRNATYVLTPHADVESHGLVDALKRTLQLIGARVEVMSAEAHDHAMAYFSHLPQLLSSALASTIKSEKTLDLRSGMTGPGYRDMTRLAASSWNIWRDIFATNADWVEGALEDLMVQLELARDDLRNSAASRKEFPAIRAQFASHDSATVE